MNFEHGNREPSFGGQLIFPRFVYHATLLRSVPHLMKRVLDRSWWRKTDRDFGAALYTTISFAQSVDWAIKAEEKNIGSTGCIVKIRCFPEQFNNFSNCLVFLGETDPRWAAFIVDHRYECDDTGKDPCGSRHPAIVIGQMADNKMDAVKHEYEKRKHDILDKYEWFSERMTRSKQGVRLDALQLGNQIAFCDEGLNEMLQVVSYFIYDPARREWVEHDVQTGAHGGAYLS